jgi:SOS-response transcriptional repressor LexA
VGKDNPPPTTTTSALSPYAPYKQQRNKAFAVSVGKDGCGDFAVLDDYIIFDPDVTMETKDYVLVQFGEQPSTIMQYVTMADKSFFEDLSRRYPPIEITDVLDYKQKKPYY